MGSGNSGTTQGTSLRTPQRNLLQSGNRRVTSAFALSLINSAESGVPEESSPPVNNRQIQEEASEEDFEELKQENRQEEEEKVRDFSFADQVTREVHDEYYHGAAGAEERTQDSTGVQRSLEQSSG